MSNYNGFKGDWRNGFESNSDQLGQTDVATGVTLTMCDI